MFGWKIPDVDGVHLGRRPPPIGGVSVHLIRVKSALREAGYCTPIVSYHRRGGDFGLIQSLAVLGRALRRRLPIWVHFSGLGGGRCLRLAVALTVLGRCRVYLVPHSGRFPEEIRGSGLCYAWLRWGIRRSVGALCFNSEIRDALGNIAPKLNMEWAVPFVPDATLRTIRREGAEGGLDDVVMVSGVRNQTYNYIEVIRAVELVREAGRVVRLIVVGCGSIDEEYWARVRREGEKVRYVMVMEDVETERFLKLLQGSALYVRNTSHDSYGVACAEALYLGTPVLASDVCERVEGAWIFRRGGIENLAVAMSCVLEKGRSGVKEVRDGSDSYRKILSKLSST